MGLSAVFALSINAQNSIKIKNPANKGEFKNASAAKGGTPMSPSQITGGIVCNTGYVAGTTMNLLFTVDLTNTDSEYGDSLAITFPTGITPNTSASNTPSVGTGAAYIEMLNPIAGQTISWGDNDNNYGGIVPGNSYSLQVNVTIGAGVTSNQTASFDVSGDTYGAAPGDLIGGTLTIYPVVSSVGVKTIAANDAITIFPNPTSGVLNINAVEVNSSVELFNVIGDKVYTANLTKGNNTLDLSALANGVYFVKLNSNDQIITKKVVLTK